MLQRSLLLVSLVCVTVLAFAQPGPTQPTEPTTPLGGNVLNGMTVANTAVEANAFGVFLIHNGVIARYSPDMQLQDVKELFDPLPPQPQMPQTPNDADRQKVQEWLGLLRARQAPFSALADDTMLHLVIGTQYFRVNAQTLAIEAHGNLAAPPNQAATAPLRQPPILKLAGETLYVVLGQEFLAVHVADGTVINRTQPPKAMFPAVDLMALRNVFRPTQAPKPNAGTPNATQPPKR